jgi:hypothetical protein
MSYFEETTLKGDQDDNSARNIEDLLEETVKQLKIIAFHLALITDQQINGEEVD